MSNLVDLLAGDILISDMSEGSCYIVGSSCGKRVYFCRRLGCNFYSCTFKFNLNFDFAVRVENNTRVQGFNKKENRFFEEYFQFNKVTVRELLFNKIPSFAETVYGMGYVKELVPAVIMNL